MHIAIRKKICYTIDTKGKKINPEKDVRDKENDLKQPIKEGTVQ